MYICNCSNITMKGEKAYKEAKYFGIKMYKEEMDASPKRRQKVYARYLYLLRKAAYMGNSNAMYELALEHEDANFLSNNNPNYSTKKMFYWQSKACTNNHGDACSGLALMYENGIECKKDLRKALELNEKSAALGSDLGKKNLKAMKKQMSKGGRYYD